VPQPVDGRPHRAGRFPDPPHQLTRALPDWPAPGPARAAVPPLVGILPGEGIGPEITEAAVAVLRRAASQAGIELDFAVHQGPTGAAAEAAAGRALTAEVAAFCQAVFEAGGAVLSGPCGGRFVYDLRARFDLYCKLVPIHPRAALREAGVIRSAARDGVDLLIVRENTGGCYFGRWARRTRPDGSQEARHVVGYRDREIARVVAVAIGLARGRRSRLALAVKPSAMPALSQLWAEVFRRMTAESGVDAVVLEADNAGYQLVAAAREFDVVVAPNHWGDMLGDMAALLLGSRGLSYSANLGPAGRAVYQTAHGAAWDLAGKGTANPLGMLAAATMMLRESFAQPAVAQAIEAAIDRTLEAGLRTSDVAEPGARVVSTRELEQEIVRAIAAGPRPVPVAP
jgi:3-isopropylmalate dehydrogenase